MVEKFLNLIKEASGIDDLFGNEDGILSTTVHTGRTIEAFDLRVEFPQGYILITTRSFLGVTKPNLPRVRALLDSINDIIPEGYFFIEKSAISFSMRCRFDNLTQADNPFDIIFYGCETFEKYEEAILKSLLVSSVFYISDQK